MPICIPFHWFVVGTSPILYRVYPEEGDRKHKKGEVKRDRHEEHDSFEVNWLPCLGSVCLVKHLSAWAELSCNLLLKTLQFIIPNFCCNNARTEEEKLANLTFGALTQIAVSMWLVLLTVSEKDKGPHPLCWKDHNSCWVFLYDFLLLVSSNLWLTGR